MKHLFISVFLFSFLITSSQPKADQKTMLPIIDMHMHALKANAQGPPPITFCLPRTELPVWDQRKPYAEGVFKALASGEPCTYRIKSPLTDEELKQRTLDLMQKYNMYGILSGSETDNWMLTSPGRFIPGLQFSFNNSTPSLDSFKSLFTTGHYKIFGEVTIQYGGYLPSDSLFEPYLAIAEELDIPLNIHIGTGPMGAPYLGFNKYRGRMHSALLLEEVLIKHPKLRVYIAHAGWPMLDDLLALLWTHPQVYIDLGVISFVLPRKEFHRYLQRIVEAGFGKRVMFGSDQMVWPEAIEVAIESIETASFLTAGQKRDIFYNNAARFLRLSDDEINRHHKRN